VYALQTGLHLRTVNSGMSRSANEEKPNKEVIKCIIFDLFGSLYMFDNMAHDLFFLHLFSILVWFYELVKTDHGNLDLQLIRLREELERLHQENRKLRSRLDLITKNYSELQGQLLVAMQKQAQQNRQEQVDMVFSDHS
jgi:predicted ribosome quality control (RQC) complex YloA/Tae2 family protein